MNYDTWWMEPVPSAVIESYDYYCVCIFLAENGMLASRIEILTRYHNDTVKKMGTNPVGVTMCVCVCVYVCVCVCGLCDQVCGDHVTMCVGIM